MKTRRSDRLIDMTNYLMERPHTLISLTFFADRYESAKSSISEDLAIVKRTFKNRGIGILETIPGAAGGARFIPSIDEGEARDFINGGGVSVNGEVIKDLEFVINKDTTIGEKYTMIRRGKKKYYVITHK